MGILEQWKPGAIGGKMREIVILVPDTCDGCRCRIDLLDDTWECPWQVADKTDNEPCKACRDAERRGE
jgi:hypothetical protein